MWAAIYVVLTIFGVFTAFHATLQARTTHAAIAWAIGLVSFPIISLPLYFIFGLKKIQGRKRIKKIRQFKGSFKKKCTSFIDNDKNNYQLNVLEQLAQSNFTKNNKINILKNGDETFEDLWREFSQAQHYILIQFYIVKEGKILDRFMSELKAAINRKVKIYFLYDEVGSIDLLEDSLESLKNIGVKIGKFSTGNPGKNKWQLNFRNHRKLVIIDGKLGHLGGINLADEYANNLTNNIYWRDTQIKIEGESIVDLEYSFTEDWFWATGEILDLPKLKISRPIGQQYCLILNSGPADKFESFEMCFVHLMNQATTRIVIATPYFVPDMQSMTAIKLARLRGVDITIMLPEKSDNVFIDFARLHFIKECLKSGVKVRLYNLGFMHQKIMLVDYKLATVGSANIDNRSFYLNFETTAIVYNDDFNSKVFSMLESDLKVSKEFNLSELKQLSFFQRLLFAFSRLLSPIL